MQFQTGIDLLKSKRLWLVVARILLFIAGLALSYAIVRNGFIPVTLVAVICVPLTMNSLLFRQADALDTEWHWYLGIGAGLVSYGLVLLSEFGAPYFGFFVFIVSGYVFLFCIIVCSILNQLLTKEIVPRRLRNLTLNFTLSFFVMIVFCSASRIYHDGLFP